MKKKQLAKRGARRRMFRWLGLLSVCGALAFGAYVVFLDFEVRTKFEGKRFELPARVFARPLELFVGQALKPADFIYELELLGYRRTEGEPKMGEYRQSAVGFRVHLRAFDFWDERQAATLVDVTIGEHQIDGLHLPGQSVQRDLLRLEPVEIGGIYPSKNEDRRLVRFADVPRPFIDALIAVEDQRFFEHHGVDLRAIARALVSTLTGKELQGGSTITQQLVKNFYLTPERTLKRKFNEMLMALLLEWHYDKNEILETYVNEVYFGQDAARAIHGVGLAAEFYFGLPVAQMAPHQSALLVAMLKGPAYYNPRRHPERARRRRNLVLTETHAQGFLPEWDFRTATAAPLDVVPQLQLGLSKYPSFIDLVIRQLRRDYKENDLRTEGLKIFSTLDPVAQHKAEATINARLPQLEKTRGLPAKTLQVAVVMSSRHTGEVEALIGGRDPRFEGFNRALDAQRQVGSLFKPVVFLTALQQSEQFTLATRLDDSPLSWSEPGAPVWEPRNYDNEFHGEVPAWLALAKSYNVATARLGIEVGVAQVIAQAQKLGVEQQLEPYASVLLGTGELPPLAIAQMYQSLAAGGFNMPLRAIREVLLNDGTPLKRYSIEVRQVVDEKAVYLVNRALQLAVAEGTAQGLRHYLPSSLNIAGKTGTTDDLRDSWFAGFSEEHVAVVWLGNDQNQTINLTGASGALTVWGLMLQAIGARPLVLSAPEGLVEVPVAMPGEQGAVESCKTAVSLPFIEGSIPNDLTRCNAAPSLKNTMKGWWQRLLD